MATSTAQKPMTAPPSTAYKIVDVPEIHRDVIQRYGVPGTFVGALGEGKPLGALRRRTRPYATWPSTCGTTSSATSCGSSPQGVVGTHKHRGTVVMMCLEGSVRYLEYDWVAGPGDFIYETPGLMHTLVTDHPKGVKLFGWLQGPIEFFDEHGNFAETLDVWWFMNHYESYCREHGIPLNKQLYI